MTLVSILLVLFLLAGSVLGWVAFLRLRSLTREVAMLRRALGAVTGRLNLSERDLLSQAGDTLSTPGGNPTEPGVPAADAPATSEEGGSAASRAAGARDVWVGPRGSPLQDAGWNAGRTARALAVSPGRIDVLVSTLKDQWMTWLGGLSVSLAGVFLVRYSIEQGLLGPAARVTLAVITGLLLHGAAEWLRRHNRGHYNAFAALAGGASITLYAALLAALLMYQLLPPWLVFSLLAIVSLFTLSLALVHGPVLAILGILGAYVVPLLVDTGSDSIPGLYLYSLIITAAAILLMRRVYRPWLWAGMLAGAFGWFTLSLLNYLSEDYRGYYLAALAYLLIALPDGNWLLHKVRVAQDRPVFGNAARQLALLLAVVSFAAGLLVERSVSESLLRWTPLMALLMLAGGIRPAWRWVPASALGVQLLAWFARGLDLLGTWHSAGLSEAAQASFLYYAAWMAVLTMALSYFNFVRDRHSVWTALTVAAPLAWLALSYLLVTDLAQSVYWGSLALLIGLLYLSVAFWRLGRSARGEAVDEVSRLSTVWLIAAGHFGYSLAVAIVVRESTLTLALATQLVSLTWLIRQFQLPVLALLVKAVVGLVVVRLTLNPWLLTYSSEVHWSLWTYGGATLLAGLASRLIDRESELCKWLEAATLHLLVLTLWAETRYWLYDGNVFALRFELTEFAVNTAVWSTLALVYYRRHLVGQLLAGWYLFASKALLGLAVLSYALVLFPLNPAWGIQQVGDTPVLNLLLLAYGYPVLISGLLYRYYLPSFRRSVAYAGCAAAFVFVNLEIRHLWQGTVSLNRVTGNGELYTYTIVWLLIAIGVLLAGSLRLGRPVYRGGMALLMGVVAKIFLVDMADLEGLLRVTSFMGLGLSLLGLAYLYQRFNLAPGHANEE